MPVRIEELEVVPQPPEPSDAHSSALVRAPSLRLAEEIAREIAVKRARELRLRAT